MSGGVRLTEGERDLIRLSWPHASDGSIACLCIECQRHVNAAVERIVAERIVAERVAGERAEAAFAFADWVARARAYNGSDHERGQVLYDECLNAVLPKWAVEWAEEQRRALDDAS